MLRITGYLLSIFLLFGFSAHSLAGDKSAEASIHEIVKNNVDELVAKYQSEREHFENDPDRFYNNMDDALSKIIDFRRFAARVMGKYAKRADKEQRDRFVEVFKTSLFQTYAGTLVESGTFEINVLKTELNSRSDKRASVDLEVISQSGNVYPIIYSMYKNKQDQWLLENVIVFGVNIGLAFRDRFETAMRTHKGNVDAVIDSWSVQLDIKQPEKG